MTRLPTGVDGEQLAEWRQKYDQLDFERQNLRERYGFEQLEQRRARREELTTEMVAVLQEFVTEELSQEDSYKTQMLQLLTAFEQDIKPQHLAKAVGCSLSHAEQFTWDEERQEARLRDWAQREAANRASHGKTRSIKKRDNYVCLRCGASATESNLNVHHITPVGRGGTDDNANLATLCESCHATAHGGSISSSSVVYDDPAEFWRWADED